MITTVNLKDIANIQIANILDSFHSTKRIAEM